MPRIVITDETAAAQALATDPSHNFAVGSGAGVDRLTTNGSAVATTGGVAASSTVDSTSVSLATGSVSVAAGGTAAVSTTVATREPTVSFPGSRMAVDTGGVLKHIPLFQCSALSNGSFTIENNDTSGASSPSTANYQYM